MNTDALTAADIVLLGLVAIGIPFFGYLFHLRDRSARDRGEPFHRPRAYIQTIAFLWLPATFLIGYWMFASRNFGVLGFTLPFTAEALATWVIVAVIGLAFSIQMAMAHTKVVFARKILNQYKDLGDTVRWLPKTLKEFVMFCGLSITAGITEELMFRAFLIWGGSHWMPVWAASLIALAAFMAAHLYQEKPSLIARVGLVGAVFTLVYLWSGSLWPAIVLHAIVDIASGGAYFLAHQNIERCGDPEMRGATNAEPS